MNPWIRALHVVMLVGGGFTGLSLTLAMAFGKVDWTGADRAVMAFACCLYLFCVIAGILVSDRPNRHWWALIAYALQTPWFASPFLTYRFGGGAMFNVYSVDGELGFRLQMGASWFFQSHGDPHWGIGCNLVALAMAIFVLRTWLGPRWKTDRPLGVVGDDTPQ